MVLPAFPPLVVYVASLAIEKAGHQWNVHGDALGMFFLFFASLFIGFVVEVLALAKAIPVLARRADERSPTNLFCAGLGVAFLLACVALAVWVYAAAHKA